MRKDLDSWSEVLIVDPVTSRIVAHIQRYKKIKPLHLTFMSFIFGISGVFFFLQAQRVLAAIFLMMHIFLDGMDGKLCRIRGEQGYLHGVTDQFLDQIIFCSFFVSIALLNITDNTIVLLILLIITFLYISEVVYALRQELMLRKGGSGDVVGVKKRYNLYIKFLPRNRIFNFVKLIHELTFKYGTFPYPKISDVRFLLFFYLLIPHHLLVLLMILFILPDFLISLALAFLHATKLQGGGSYEH